MRLCSVEAQNECAQNKNLATATTCATKYTPDTSPTAPPSTSLSETVQNVFPPNCSINGDDSRPGTDPSGFQVNSVADETHNPDTNAPEATVNVTLTPHRHIKPALIPQAPFSTLLPAPTSQRTLCDNLRLSLKLKPLPKFPALIDYHDSYPKFRSTNSYNFLIELSIRHAQFGITHWLFDAMVQDKIPRDSTTRKLSIRWLVRTGHWEQAWIQVTGLTPDEALDKPLRNGLAPVTTRIPWYMWQELLFASKRGALRRKRGIRWSTDEDGDSVCLPMLEVINDPAPGTEAYLRRQRLLACVQPVLDSGAKGHRIRPSLVESSVNSMIREGRGPVAVDLAKAYFSTLPPTIGSETAAQCMDIIHSLLSANTKNGLASMYANHRLLVSLLKTHPSFKPSSTTLFLLLSPLQRVKKSGTVAFKITKAFRKQWGAEVVDIRVRRRVGSLAVKEGRMDIVQRMLEHQTLARRADDANASSDTAVHPTTQEPPDPRCLRRPPDRELFPHVGRERILWTRFKLRLRWKQHAKDRDNSDTVT